MSSLSKSVGIVLVVVVTGAISVPFVAGADAGTGGHVPITGSGIDPVAGSDSVTDLPRASHRQIRTQPDEWDPEAGPIVVEGNGAGTVGVFDLREGILTIHIEYDHDADDETFRTFQLDLHLDNNLDGEYNDVGDGLGRVGFFARDYSGGTEFEATKSVVFHGGRLKVTVPDLGAGGDWKITIRNRLKPVNRIYGSVWTYRPALENDPDADPFMPGGGGIRVVAVDDRGNTYTTTTERNSSFVLDVFRFRDYRVYVHEPGLGTTSVTVTEEEFRTVGYPTWGVNVGRIDLEPLEDNGTVAGTIIDADSGSPIEGARVRLIPEDHPIATATTRTDADGRYRFNFESKTPFTLKADALLYESNAVGPIELETDRTKTVDIELKQPLINLGVDVGARPHAALVGEEVTYVTTIANTGSRDTDVVLEHSVEEIVESGNASVVSMTASRGTCDESRCDLGEMPAGTMARVKVTMKVDRPGTVEYVALARGDHLDIQPADNKASVTTTTGERLVTGQVTVYAPLDSPQSKRPLIMKGVAVDLYVDGSRVKRTFADDEGYYVFEDVQGEEFHLEVSLMDEENTFIVGNKLLDSPFKGAQTKPEQLDDRKEVYDIKLSDRNTDLNISNRKRKYFMHAAVFYHYTYEAAQYAKETLGLESKLSPGYAAQFWIFHPSKGLWYEKGSIYINKGNSRSYRADVPDNRDYHEFGHHVQARSKMGEARAPDATRLPQLANGDLNHAGVENSDSLDSVREGFAEFYAALVKDSPKYHTSEGVKNLQQNVHRKNGRPDEEFNVAALLWDLQDEDEERGDYISMDVRKLWAILNHEDVTTVRSLYLRLKRSSIDGEPLARMDSNETDGLSDLDALFVLHGFYDDTNDNDRWDRNVGGGPFDEPVGYAHRWDNKTRENYPTDPWRGLKLAVDGPDGDRLNATYTVAVDYPDGESDYEYIAHPNREGVIGLFVPPSSVNVTIRPIVPGYTGDPLVLTPNAYQQAITEAREANREVFMTHRFEMEPTDVPPPTDVEMARLDDAGVRLQWNLSATVDRAIVVRGVGAVPSSPADGEVVYEGDATEAFDIPEARGYEYRYAVFAVEAGEFSTGASAESVGRDGDTVGGLLDELLPIALVGGAVVLFAMALLFVHRWIGEG